MTTPSRRPLPLDALRDVALDPEFVAASVELFEQRIVFNRLLGLRHERVGALVSEATLEMRTDLIGHFGYQRMHGGVIASALDAIGGFAIMNAIGARYAHEPLADRLKHFARLGTIDLRIDYMHPAIGERFIVRGEVLRLGSRLATTRSEFLSADRQVLALGAASYIVS